MSFFIIVTLLIVAVLTLGAVEYMVHKKNVHSIPIRVHVNGTRGKSSVSRLIAAGLNAGGIKTFAKTTGTLARVITNDGQEYPVYRPVRANIIEQLRVFSFAARNGAEAIVIECMALVPAYQSLTELKIVKATHGVITNARADHLDVMGPNEVDVAKALLGTTPKKAKLFTCERDYIPLFESACKDRGSELFVIMPEDAAAIPEKEMEAFSYVEHRDNVALALKVCESAGVPKDVALKGMHHVKPDVGAMGEYEVDFFGRKLVFINGFAANDPESSEQIWDIALARHSVSGSNIMVINTRADRPDRSIQLGEALAGWKKPDHVIVIGTGTEIFIKKAVAAGMDFSGFTNCESLPVEEIFEVIIGLSGKHAMIMGIGNIKDVGLQLVKYFKNRTIVK